MIKFEQKIRTLVRDAYTKCAVIKARLTNPNDFNRARRCAFDTDDEFTPCIKEVCVQCEHFPADEEGRDRMYGRNIHWCIFGCFIRCFNEGYLPCQDCVHDLTTVRQAEKEKLEEAAAEKPQTEKTEEVPFETEKDNEIPINSCLYDVNIECSGGYRYFDISDEERELIKKKICTKCRDGKCVIMDDVICPKGSYGASDCGDCELRPRSPAQEFFAMEARKCDHRKKPEA